MAEFVFRSEYPDVELVNEPLNETLYRVIDRSANQKRTAFVLAETHEVISYTKLRHAILVISEYLESCKFGHQDIACAVLKNCWQFSAIFVSIVSRGGVLSPASPLFTQNELQKQFIDSNSKIVFCQQYSLESVLKAAPNCPKLKTIILLDGPSHGLPFGTIHLNDILKKQPKCGQPNFCSEIRIKSDILSCTNCFSGVPKGTMLSHFGLGNLLKIASEHFNTRVLEKIDSNWRFDQEYFIHLLPFYHIYGKKLFVYFHFFLGFGMMLYGILNGAQAVILEKFVPELFLQMIKIVPLVPPIVIFLSRSPLVDKYDLSSLQFLFSGAAPLGKEIIEAVCKRLKSIKQISQAYGMTEESMCSHLPVFGMENHAAAGRLMANYEMKIIDLETSKSLGYNKIGEILIRSPTLMLGYFNNPKATRECLDSDGYLHTGDIGFQDENGWTYVVDRKKELIKVKGMQVAPAELEDLLLAHPKVADCAVIGIADSKTGEKPKAYVVVTAGSDLTASELMKFVADRVASYKQLAEVEFVSEIEKSPSGKILRRLLRDRAKL
ncbi:hypothetical protein M3Y98_00937300 [Aphelenchoides besseyi]|nr:hypothetical protein M3Y98_00937300 [Aphelenchoides besseyi]KAI6194304.1 hypothetical protein M3Y96_01110800 [Aphelenchoides besseyi]